MDIPTPLLEKILARLHRYAPDWANIKDSDLEPIGEGIWRMHFYHDYFVKWIPAGDELRNNEFKVNRSVLPLDGMNVPRFLMGLPIEGGIIAFWEWLESEDLRRGHRELLPEAFTRLGEFHQRQRGPGPVVSQVTKRSFETVHELLQDELETLSAGHAESVVLAARRLFPRLESGYITRIHGDMHPGNMLVTQYGLMIADWSYSVRSLNLFDLGYIQAYSPKEQAEDEWWHITPGEADQILPAYYAACGMEDPDPPGIQQAVMLWSQLWSCYNAARNGDPALLETSRRQVVELVRQLQ